ncbi:transcriptional regulator [Verrucosispora sp. FIM060022]|uniref:transcriptional regulator n=1 Tax=Verrucosispora sp. FIM060022 TaxID=1479020 RepID=UPI000F87568F|nr:transcriptional regulator [Verrucosispora sp. FIM060022]RUL94345.1 transcriptional regulator [Verrucosispora sp. FIM060022]
MHPPEIRARVRALRARGHNIRSVARSLDLPYTTVWHWCVDRPEPTQVNSAVRCFRCRPELTGPTDPTAYAYLLGLYLGDGHLVTSDRVPVLRIYCTDTWPNLIEACDAAMRAVLANRIQRIQKQGCVAVQSTGKHWPCLIPQHGPGKKHQRPIVLTAWQRDILTPQAGHFVRGLFHSDGCRVSNRVTVRGREYAYPRYMFVNESSDIMGLCQWALDLLGVAWAMNRRNSLSVARREAVAALDRHVGPKS